MHLVETNPPFVATSPGRQIDTKTQSRLDQVERGVAGFASQAILTHRDYQPPTNSFVPTWLKPKMWRLLRDPARHFPGGKISVPLQGTSMTMDGNGLPREPDIGLFTDMCAEGIYLHYISWLRLPYSTLIGSSFPGIPGTLPCFTCGGGTTRCTEEKAVKGLLGSDGRVHWIYEQQSECINASCKIGKFGHGDSRVIDMLNAARLQCITGLVPYTSAGAGSPNAQYVISRDVEDMTLAGIYQGTSPASYANKFNKMQADKFVRIVSSFYSWALSYSDMLTKLVGDDAWSVMSVDEKEKEWVQKARATFLNRSAGCMKAFQVKNSHMQSQEFFNFKIWGGSLLQERFVESVHQEAGTLLNELCSLSEQFSLGLDWTKLEKGWNATVTDKWGQILSQMWTRGTAIDEIMPLFHALAKRPNFKPRLLFIDNAKGEKGKLTANLKKIRDALFPQQSVFGLPAILAIAVKEKNRRSSILWERLELKQDNMHVQHRLKTLMRNTSKDYPVASLMLQNALWENDKADVGLINEKLRRGDIKLSCNKKNIGITLKVGEKMDESQIQELHTSGDFGLMFEGKFRRYPRPEAEMLERMGDFGSFVINSKNTLVVEGGSFPTVLDEQKESAHFLTIDERLRPFLHSVPMSVDHNGIPETRSFQGTSRNENFHQHSRRFGAPDGSRQEARIAHALLGTGVFNRNKRRMLGLEPNYQTDRMQLVCSANDLASAFGANEVFPYERPNLARNGEICIADLGTSQNLSLINKRGAAAAAKRQPNINGFDALSFEQLGSQVTAQSTEATVPFLDDDLQKAVEEALAYEPLLPEAPVGEHGTRLSFSRFKRARGTALRASLPQRKLDAQEAFMQAKVDSLQLLWNRANPEVITFINFKIMTEN